MTTDDYTAKRWSRALSIMQSTIKAHADAMRRPSATASEAIDAAADELHQYLPECRVILQLHQAQRLPAPIDTLTIEQLLAIVPTPEGVS